MIHGDYDHRGRGLSDLYRCRPEDLVAYDVHMAECRAGVVEYVEPQFRVAYGILRAIAESRGRSLGAPVQNVPGSGHWCRYLLSAVSIRGACGYYPPLVHSAWEEFNG